MSNTEKYIKEAVRELDGWHKGDLHIHRSPKETIEQIISDTKKACKRETEDFRNSLMTDTEIKRLQEAIDKAEVKV